MFSRRTEWPLEPNDLTREIESRRARGLPVIDLTESNPTRCGFAYDATVILRAVCKPAALDSAPDPRGPREARRAVTAYYAERGLRADPECIFLTASTSEAYSYLFRLLADPGDAVLVPQPSYPLFDFLAGLNDLEVIPYPLIYDSGWRLDLDGLAAGVQHADRALGAPRAIVVVHPNNPTGSFVKPEESAALAELCRGREMAIIADEVFSDYTLDGQPPLTHATRQEVLTFTLSGLSKVSALPQMKLAWIVVNGPVDVRRQAIERLEIIADTYLSVSAPVAAGAPELLETRRALQPQLMTRLRHNLAGLDRRFDGAHTGIVRLKVEGGWYAILKLDAGLGMSGDALATTLAREDGVLVHPGHFYGFRDDDHLVLSLLPAPEAFAAGIDKLVARLESES
jgi:alanine-synthesizing transaminase